MIFEKTKKDIIREIIAVITFGFCITGFFPIIHNYIKFNVIGLGLRDIVYILLSLISMIIIGYIKKENNLIKNSLLTMYIMFGFTLLMIPILYMIDSYIVGYNILLSQYRHMMVCYLLAIGLFMLKNLYESFIR